MRKVWRGIFLSRVATGGYENKKLIDLVIFKNLKIRSSTDARVMDLQAMRTISAIGLAAGNKKAMTVLDFGGGAGHHHIVAKLAFPEVSFNWTVVETSALTETVRDRVIDPELSFVDDVSILDTDTLYDLIYSNSALQYTESPVITLKSLLRLNFSYCFITRIPLTSRKAFKYHQESMLSQNGPGLAPPEFRDSKITYQNTIEAKDSIERLLEEFLDGWLIFDEGPWDLDMFGESVRTYSYSGFSKRRSRIE